MIFRFADNKGLTFAYSELLEFGIPKDCIVASFEEVTATPQPPAVHQSFLQHLHAWFNAGCLGQKQEDHTQEQTRPPVSPLFRKHGGTLEVESRDLATEIIAIAVHHYGEMVG